MASELQLSSSAAGCVCAHLYTFNSRHDCDLITGVLAYIDVHGGPHFTVCIYNMYMYITLIGI